MGHCVQIAHSALYVVRLTLWKDEIKVKVLRDNARSQIDIHSPH